MNSLPQTLYMNSLGSSPMMNSKTNIIAGPSPRDYWNHSPGAEKPLVQEDGPFPVQGNIGSLIAQETVNYTDCTMGPNIGSGPNCSGAFVPDMYTKKDTCGDSCVLKYPESYGVKDFGFPEGSNKLTDAHQVHAFDNIRAGMAGQSSASGCYEWIPALEPNPTTGKCEMKQNIVYSQVGNWNFLPMYSQLQNGTEYKQKQLPVFVPPVPNWSNTSIS